MDTLETAKNSRAKRIVVDTSFILHCLERHVDFIELLKGEQFLPVVPEIVVEELKTLAKRNPLARIALKLISSRTIPIVRAPAQLVGDDAVLHISELYGNLATSDKKMRRRARERGIFTYSLRKGKLWKC